MEKKKETKEKGNYYRIYIYTYYWAPIGMMKKKMETTLNLIAQHAMAIVLDLGETSALNTRLHVLSCM